MRFLEVVTPPLMIDSAMRFVLFFAAAALAGADTACPAGQRRLPPPSGPCVACAPNTYNARHDSAEDFLLEDAQP